MTDTAGKPNKNQDSAFSMSAGSLFDIDFDVGDFDFDNIGVLPDERTRILKPKFDKEILTQTCHFVHAEQFAREVDLAERSRTFAWVSGSFIFGDLPEALWRYRGVGIKEMSIATLSLSEENIDSWAALMDYGTERFDLLMSAYFYSHEKFGLIPIMYERLDKENKFQVAFGPYHCKVICIKSFKGNTIVIHGSANTRSSYSVEQVMIEVNCPELYDFNRDQIHALCEQYGTVNHKAKPQSVSECRRYFEEKRKELKQ